MDSSDERSAIAGSSKVFCLFINFVEFSGEKIPSIINNVEIISSSTNRLVSSAWFYFLLESKKIEDKTNPENH